MKKFLLTLAAGILCVGAAMADATLVMKDQACFKGGTETISGIGAWTNGDFTLTPDKAAGTTAPSYNKAGDVRLYAQNTLKITAKSAMTKIAFNISSQGLKQYATITASVGTVTQAAANATLTWTGNATEVTFTVGATNDFGSATDKNAGQFDFTQVDITGGGNANGAGDGPVPVALATYKKASAITSGSAYIFVAGGKYNVLFDRNYGYMTTTELGEGSTEGEVKGEADAAMTFTAVTGGYTITTTKGRALGAKTGYKTFDTTDDSADNRVWTVAIAADGTATITNVATGLVVYQDPAYGSFGCYGSEEIPDNAVKPTLYVLNGETPIIPVDPIVTEIFELATSIVSGAEYVMAVDGKVGKMIDKTKTYGRLDLEAATFADNKVTTNADYALTITTAGAGYSIKDTEGRYLGFDGEHTTSFQLYTETNEYTTWTILFEDEEASITMTVAGKTATIGVTKGTSDTWYTNIAPSVDAAEILLPTLYVKSTSSAIESVAVQNAPVEYFNLQGVRVANPENGLYIRRQGNAVSKVYVK